MSIDRENFPSSEIPVPSSIGMFEDAPGSTSSTRVKSFLCLLAAFAVAGVTMTRETHDGLLIFLLLLLAAFAPQALHKVLENKIEKENQKS